MFWLVILNDQNAFHFSMGGVYSSRWYWGPSAAYQKPLCWNMLQIVTKDSDGYTKRRNEKRRNEWVYCNDNTNVLQSGTILERDFWKVGIDVDMSDTSPCILYRAFSMKVTFGYQLMTLQISFHLNGYQAQWHTLAFFAIRLPQGIF